MIITNRSKSFLGQKGTEKNYEFYSGGKKTERNVTLYTNDKIRKIISGDKNFLEKESNPDFKETDLNKIIDTINCSKSGNNNFEEINDVVDENLTEEQKEILKELKKCKDIESLVNCFARLADKFGIEAIVSLLRCVGDRGCALISILFFCISGAIMGLPKKDYIKILRYQGKDAIIGSIPVVGSIIDFFNKSNVSSAKLFTEKMNALIKEAKERGVPQEEIDKIMEKKNIIRGLLSRGFDRKIERQNKKGNEKK